MAALLIGSVSLGIVIGIVTLWVTHRLQRGSSRKEDYDAHQ